jgi:hypothetical protein
MELEIDFVDIAPPQEQSLALEVTAAQTHTGGTLASYLVGFGESGGSSGSWDWYSDKLLSFYDGVSSVTDYTNRGGAIEVDGGRIYEIFADLLLSAVLPEERKDSGHGQWFSVRAVAPEPEVGKGLKMVRRRGKIVAAPTSIAPGTILYSAPSYEWAKAHPYQPSLRAPETAGDVTLGIHFRPQDQVPGSPDTALYISAYGPGPLYAELLLQYSVDISVPGTLSLLCQPTGTEARTVDPTSSLQIDVVTSLTSST